MSLLCRGREYEEEQKWKWKRSFVVEFVLFNFGSNLVEPRIKCFNVVVAREHYPFALEQTGLGYFHFRLLVVEHLFFETDPLFDDGKTLGYDCGKKSEDTDEDGVGVCYLSKHKDLRRPASGDSPPVYCRLQSISQC